MSATKYGLIGHPLGHSLSPYIHERIMDAAGISGRYELYDLSPQNFARDLTVLLRELQGFNCTIPYKMDVIPFLDSLDETASRYSAVNTVMNRRGYNTDRDGFLSVGLDLAGKKVLILGAGGVSRMMAYEALAQKAKIWICARNPQKAHKLTAELIAAGAIEASVLPEEELHMVNDSDAGDLDVVLNGTPLGMWPFCGELASPPSIFRTGQQVFDTVYNPAATKWVLHAKKNGAHASGGLSMLFRQAVAAEKIWHPDKKFEEARLLPILPDLSREMLRHSPVKYVFTGFMGAGKTTISKEVARILKIPVYDLDDQIEERRGCSVAEIFARDGEAGFRKAEVTVIKELLSKEGSALIATGGGALMQDEVRASIRSHGAMVVYLHASLDCLWTRVGNTAGRPLLGDPCGEASDRFSKVACLYEVRLPTYESFCDIKIDAEKNCDAVVHEVISALGYGG